MKDVLAVYPSAKVQNVFGGIRLLPSPVPKISVVVRGRVTRTRRCGRAAASLSGDYSPS